MKQRLLFFSSQTIFSRQKSKVLLLIWFLCGGSESLCQRFVAKFMTYDMVVWYGKESKHGHRALYARAARYKVIRGGHQFKVGRAFK